MAQKYGKQYKLSNFFAVCLLKIFPIFVSSKKLLNHCCKNHNKIRLYFYPTETARHWQTPGSWWGMPESIIFWVHQKKGEIKKID